MAQQFELERMTRTIDETRDPQTLRNLAKLLLKSWHGQKAATEWMIRQQLSVPMRATPAAVRPKPFEHAL